MKKKNESMEERFLADAALLNHHIFAPSRLKEFWNPCKGVTVSEYEFQRFQALGEYRWSEVTGGTFVTPCDHSAEVFC